MDGPLVQLEDLLRVPDDLDKISALKQEFTRKKNAVDSQLRTGLREQLEATQSGMNGLADGQKTLQAIKEEMMQIDKLCSESQVMIKDFASINLVSKAHHNFAAVEAMRHNLATFEERIEMLKAMLEEDAEDMENMPNLLAIHFELTQLRNIRDDAMEQSQRADDTSLPQTLEPHFEHLEDVIDSFDSNIGTIALNLINLLLNDNEKLIVRMAIIIEAEEASDQKVLALQEAFKDHKDMATRFQMITDGARQARGYKEKFLQCIEATAETQFRESRNEFMDEPTEIEGIFKWFFNDLLAVKKGLAPLMPKKWKIYKTYVGIYHQLMHDFLVEIIDNPETTAAHTLEIASWPDKYYARMQRLGVKQEELIPHVIDNRETELVRDFRHFLIKTLDQWIDLIFEKEKKDFYEQPAEGDSNLSHDEYGYFSTRHLVDLWRMLGEQIKGAGNSKREDVVEGVVDVIFSRLRTRQANWQKVLDDRAVEFENPKLATDNNGMVHLQDWLVAMANCQIATIDDNEAENRVGYLTDFRTKFEPLVTPQYMERADAEMASLRDGYIDFSTWCITRFVNVIFAVDFRVAMSDIFTPKWYDSAVMRQMITTFEDYVGDYREVLHHSLVDIFMEIFATELLVRYLSCVHNRGAKFRRIDNFEEKLVTDVRTVFEYFSEMNADLAASIKDQWRVIQHFLALLKTDKDKVADAFVEFKLAYWDLQIGWVETVLRCRDDFERSMLNNVKAKAAHLDVTRGPETVMGKLK